MEDQFVTETIEGAPEAVSFGAVTEDTYDRTGQHTIRFTVFSLATGARINRTWSGSGDDRLFIMNRLDERRVSPDSAADKLRVALHQSSGCPRPNGAFCGHPAHLERRRHFEGLIRHFGLQQD